MRFSNMAIGPVTHTPNALSLIEEAGRVCYKSESKIAKGTAADFCRMLIRRGHESVLEHACASFQLVCNRGLTHELVRHRLASFSQESTRYVDYKGGHVEFIIPLHFTDTKPGTYKAPMSLGPEEYVWQHAMMDAESAYHALRNMGVAPQYARGVLPIDVKTEIIVTANFREWRHIIKLRTSKAAHPQIRWAINGVYKWFHQFYLPIVEDLEYGAD